MGKTLQWYLLKSFWSTLLIIIFTFIFLVFCADILDNLDDFISYRLPLQQYLNYYLYTIPTVFIICLPVAVLLSGMKVFRNLSVNNEYVALIMGGIPLRNMLLPVAFSALFLSCISLLVTDRVAPSTRFKRKVMQKEKFKIKRMVLKSKNLIGKDGRKYYFNEYHKKEKRITGLMITESDAADNIKLRIFAETVNWDGSRWTGQRVKFQPYRSDGIPTKPEHAVTHTFEYFPSPSEILLSRTDPKYLDLKSLKSLIKSIPAKIRRSKPNWKSIFIASTPYPFCRLSFFSLPFPFPSLRSGPLPQNPSVSESLSAWSIISSMHCFIRPAADCCCRRCSRPGQPTSFSLSWDCISCTASRID